MGAVTAEVTRASRQLGATYRLQLHGEFPLAKARGIVGYLRELGVTHLYASPVLRARAGSRHGYDVVDPAVVSPELGSDGEWRALAGALHAVGLGAVLDVVPNHMGAGPDNPYWVDVLRHGKGSRWAHWFDIDWSSPPPYADRVMLPVLGDELEAVLKKGELAVVRAGGEAWVKYYDNRYPLRPDVPTDLPLGELLARQHYALAFWRRASTDINYRRFFDVNDLVALRAEDPRVFEETHALVLEWVADGTLDGIRIDHVDGLLDPRAYLERLRAAVRARGAGDDFPIFVEKILSAGERLREGWPVQGTTGYEFLNLLENTFVNAEGFRRIEATYQRLRAGPVGEHAFEEEALRGKEEVLTGALTADVTRLTRLLVPLSPPLPGAGAAAAASGGRGRDVEPDARLAPLLVECITCLPVYRTYIDGRGPAHPDDAAFLARARDRARARGKVDRALVDWFFAQFQNVDAERDAERAKMVTRFQQTSGPATAKGVEDTAIYRYFPLASRNEVGGGPEGPLGDAVRTLHETNAERRARWPRNLLATNTHDTKRSADVRARLAALSEVPDEWHAALDRWRGAATAHRSATPMGVAPDANDEYLAYQTIVGAWPVSKPGTAPAGRELAAFRDRVKAYMEKAMRESKRITSWTEPDGAYEKGVAAFLDRMLREGSPFVRDVAAFVGRISRAAMWTALSRVALHLTSPGTPDLYQGDELWNLSLVDPDNRRPVDYALRARLLADLDERARAVGGQVPRALLADLLGAPEDGRVKLWTVSRVLRARRDRLPLFANGSYVPLLVRGARAEHIVAFARRSGGATAVTLAPRMSLTLAGGEPPIGDVWGDTIVEFPEHLKTAPLRCAVSGVRPKVAEGPAGGLLSVADALRFFPVGVFLTDL